MNEAAHPRPGARRGSPGYLSALRNRDFAVIWSGKAVSNLGDGLRNVALIWLVKETTGSAAAMSTVMLCAMLPYLVFGLVAGSVVDLVDRKRVMVWSDIGRGLLSLSVPLLLTLGRLGLPHLCLMAFLMSTLSAFFNPAMTASIPNVVGRDHLLAANALNALTVQVSGIVGPALGGAVVGLWGTAPAFLADGVSFLVSAAAIQLARIPGARPAEAGPGAGLDVRQVLAGVKGGFVFILERPLLASVIGVAVGLNFILAPVEVLLALHVDRVWHAGAQAYGLLGSAVSAGMVAGTLLAAPAAAVIKRETMVWAGVGAMGLALLGLVFGPTPAYGAAACILAGLANPIVNIPLSTWAQQTVPDRVRGRVFGALEVGCQAAVPVALALTGVACDAFGTRAIFAAASGVTVTGSLALAWVFRVHRKRSGLDDSLAPAGGGAG